MQLLTRLSLYLIALLLTINSVNAQTYQWVKGGGSNHDLTSSLFDEHIRKMCTDAHGNLYVLAVMGGGSMVADTFDRPGAYGIDNNIFLASYTCSGQMRWAKLIGSANNTWGYDIAADASGHIYLAGKFTHIAGSHNLFIGYDATVTPLLYQADGLIQFDTSGTFNWITVLGDNTFAASASIGGQYGALVVDGADHPHYVCNTKPGSHFTSAIPTRYGVFDVVFDAAGTMLSATGLPQDTTLLMQGAALDTATNKLYIYGRRHGDFMPGVDPMTIHSYLAAFDPSRNLLWTDTLANTGTGNPGFGGIVNDRQGNLYLTGGAYGAVIYRNDTTRNVIVAGGAISAVLKIDTAGSLKWMRGYSAALSSNGFASITLMAGNKIAVGGLMLGMVIGGNDTVISYASETINACFSILDTAGYVHTIQQIHGSGGADYGYAITADKTGSLYLGGSITSNVWAGSLTPYTSVGGNTDFFVIKYGVDCNCTYMPTANYTVSGSTTKTFTYTGTTTAIDSVRWEFGDGGTSTLMSPTHTYTTGDTFTACVTVYTACGSDMHCSDFIIPCVAAPTATYSTSGTGLTKTFTYTGSGLGTGTLSWNFGDGTSLASGTPVAHTFSAAGTYNVCLTATNSCGSNVSCTMVTVTCITSPTSAFTISGTGASRSFTYTGTTAGLDSVTWTFGDGGVATSLTPSHSYLTTGIKTICATVHTNCGTATACHTVNIACIAAPVALFTFSGTGASISFNFTGTSTAVDSVRWNFGDGGTATGLTPGHTYAATGTYHVCVTVYTACGSNTICHDVIVTCIATVTAAFTDTGNKAHGFVYTGTTSGLDSVVWNYGDSHRDTGLIKLHTYAVADTYHVCVIVYTDCGNDTVCRDIIITGPTLVEMLSLSDIRVFPNPATNELSIKGIPSEVNYRILTVTGINLQAGMLHIGTNAVMLPNISAGMYILEMTGPTGEKNTMRFIKG